MTIRRTLPRIAMLVTVLLSPLAATHAQTVAPISAEAFFKKPAVRAPALSPSGKKVAMLVPTQSGRVGLAVANAETPDKFVGIAQFEDADVQSFSWVNDQRLVFGASDEQAALGDQFGSGLYAVNADGSDFIWLIERTGNYRVTGVPSKRPLPNRYRYAGPTEDGSDDVLVERWIPAQQRSKVSSSMMRLNTKTMATKSLYSGDVPDSAQGWVLDQKLQPRVLTTFDDKENLTIHWRNEGGTDWIPLSTYSIWDTDEKAIAPVAVDRDGNFYVAARVSGTKDKTNALFKYDVQKKQLSGEPLLSIPGFDFASSSVQGFMMFDANSKQLLGVRYYQDAPGVAWFEPSMRAHQESIDKLLPNTINMISCERCVGATNLVVSATSDIQSPVFFMFNTATKKLSLLGSTRPWLDSRAMAGTQDFVRVKVRDGMEIPTYITKPKGKGPWPTIMMVHGGPNVRGHMWGFNAVNQFLASRGYMVIETEFRGSEGYGDTLFKAGFKQWGLSMQDDVTDVTLWAIANNMADPKRIAIAGGSYGGYATMLGLMKEPELYKAGINIVGVTDIELMFTIGWSDFQAEGGAWAKFGMKTRIGDPVKDAAQLKATSPLQNASKIKQPVLMAYGVEDYRVPLPHGTKMRDALIASGNKNVEWVQYENEGHGFMLTKNNVDLWTRAERFLATHLK